MRAPIERRPPYGLAVWAAVSVILSLIVYASPAHLTQGPDLMPLLPLIAIYIWSCLRPRFMPPFIIFLIGIMQDLLTGGPMGIWALAFLTALMILRVRKEEGATRELGPIWLRFVGVVAIATIVAWCTGSLAIGGPAAVRPMLIEAVASVLMFPLIGLLTIRKRTARSSFG
ncbi:hypothetical protein [Hyphobacterium marinum]|uniref:Rod shape-determining protein MreD n=1 Tax=Hyphobacterium marinum TaxID=3116574 RepID=A0ABU7M0A2_9PROT|nr:hypothetical protein [Hyphobacterium sp. Y6023]MEE2566972.1 hypothetical protein [Hyphobacterium sp. Y6023]